jgi:hypothetical protein
MSCAAVVHRKRCTSQDSEDERGQSGSSGGGGTAGGDLGSEFSGCESESSEDLDSEVTDSKDAGKTPVKKPKQA